MSIRTILLVILILILLGAFPIYTYWGPYGGGGAGLLVVILLILLLLGKGGNESI